MSDLKRILVAAFISVLSCAAQQPPRAPFSITVSTADKQVRAGSVVRVTVTFTNTSNHKLAVGRSPGRDQGEFDNQFEVKYEGGNSAPETTYRKHLRGEHEKDEPPTIISGSEMTVWLQPDESSEESVLLDKLYDLSKPGKYTVQAWRFDYYVTKAPVKSNVITLTVTP